MALEVLLVLQERTALRVHKGRKVRKGDLDHRGHKGHREAKAPSDRELSAELRTIFQNLLIALLLAIVLFMKLLEI